MEPGYRWAAGRIVHRGRVLVAERADVRYTADARVWCAVALGLIDPRQPIKLGTMTKEGGKVALDHYFHQPSRSSRPRSGREGDTEESR